MTVVAIDGPAGAGKSTIARAVAQRLGFRYIDTGGMYRAVALASIEAGVERDDEIGLSALLDDLEIEARDGQVSLDGRDVTERVRAPDVTERVPRVAASPAVRRSLLEHQRAMAAGSDVVMEGRDVGTVVFPDADVKIFLTADPRERARRRWAQDPSIADSLDEVERLVVERDRLDQQRELAPLVRAGDAVEVDTTGLTIEQVTVRIADLVAAKSRR